MAQFQGLQYTPTQADTPVEYGGDISGFLGKTLNYGDLTSLNRAMGTPNGSQSTFTQNGNIYGIGDNGNGTYNLRQIDTVANRQNQANSANFGNLVNASDKAVTDFLTGYKGDVQNAITSANATFNLPTLENAVTGLTSRINDLANNTSNSGGGAAAGTGLGGYNSEAQVGAELNSRELPALNAASANLNTASGLAQNQEQIALQPDQAYEDLLKTNITTAMSGLTATQQTEMEGIIAKINAGVTLTTAEIQAGENYAATVLNNANAITLKNMTNAYTPVPSGSSLVSPYNGKIINPGVLAASGAYSPS